MIALPCNRTNLRCKTMGLRPTGEPHGKLMQSAECCSGPAQPLSSVRVKSPRVIGQGQAAKSRIKDHRVRSHVGERP